MLGPGQAADGVAAGGPPAPPRPGRGRGPMTREEAARLREEELASQAHGKDCFIIPQANLDRFLPDGVTVSWEKIQHKSDLQHIPNNSLALFSMKLC